MNLHESAVNIHFYATGLGNINAKPFSSIDHQLTTTSELGYLCFHLVNVGSYISCYFMLEV